MVSPDKGYNLKQLHHLIEFEVHFSKSNYFINCFSLIEIRCKGENDSVRVINLTLRKRT